MTPKELAEKIFSLLNINSAEKWSKSMQANLDAVEAELSSALEEARKQGDIVLPIANNSLLGEELLSQAKAAGYEEGKKAAQEEGFWRRKKCVEEAYEDCAEIVDEEEKRWGAGMLRKKRLKTLAGNIRQKAAEVGK